MDKGICCAVIPLFVEGSMRRREVLIGSMASSFIVVINAGKSLSQTTSIGMGWPSEAKKHGIFGGPGGDPYMDRYPGTAMISSIKVFSGTIIDGIQVSWKNLKNKETIIGSVHARQAGGGMERNFSIEDGDYLAKVMWSVGVHHGRQCISVLRFMTNNERSSDHYGLYSQDEFAFTAPSGTQILGFWGKGGSILDSIGFLVTPLPVR